MVSIRLETITKKEFGNKLLKENIKKNKTREDIIKEMHEFLIKTEPIKKKINKSLKQEIKKAIKSKKEESKQEKRIIKTREERPYLSKDYFQPPVAELPKLNYSKLFSYLASGVKNPKEATGYFEQQVKRIHANETTIEKEEAYSIIKEVAWGRTMGISLGHDALKNDGTFAYWKLFNHALKTVMYDFSFSVNI